MDVQIQKKLNATIPASSPIGSNCPSPSSFAFELVRTHPTSDNDKGNREMGLAPVSVFIVAKPFPFLVFEDGMQIEKGVRG